MSEQQKGRIYNLNKNEIVKDTDEKHPYLLLNHNHLRSIKLVIGNGFDIACGLESSYGKFFEYSKPLYNKINAWIKNNNLSFPNDELTVWDLVFVLLEKKDEVYKTINDVNWKNVEESIRLALGCLKNDEGRENCVLDYNLKEIYDILNEKPNVKVYGDFLKDPLTRYILEKNLNDKKEEEFYEDLLKELSIFEERFSNYIESKMDDIYQAKAALLLTDYLGLDLSKVRSIDTFNFTTPEIFKSIKYNYEDDHGKWQLGDVNIKHVNGQLHSAIFGIDSNGVKSNDPRYIFTKTYRKMIQLVQGKREGNDRKFDNIIAFGHSLSEADYSYFFSIMDNLNLDNFKEYASRFIVVYNDYLKDDSKAKEQYQKRLATSLLKLIDAYDKWKNPTSNRFGLVELLETSDRIGFAKIDTKPLNDLQLSQEESKKILFKKIIESCLKTVTGHNENKFGTK